MTAFIEIDGSDASTNLELGPPDGGSVFLEGGNKYLTVGPLDARPAAVPFGALDFEVPGGNAVRLSAFEYRYRDESILQRDGWLSFLAGGLPLAAAADVEDGGDVDMSRRRVLAATGAALGGGLLTMSDVAAGQSQTLRIASFEIADNDGFQLRLTDSVADVLPADQEYLLLADNVQIGALSPDDPATTLRRGMTGEVHVLTEANLSTWQQIKTGLFAEDGEDQEQQFDLTLPKAASEYEEDTEVTVASDTDAVRALVEAGPDDAAVAIGGESIRHESEDSNEEAGYWTVRDESDLIYVAGTDPPTTSDVLVETGIGLTGELADDITRRTQ
ncbi:hypothetical protein [Haloarcula argentinensis]|uniref:Uncharacterized protein n=1 Tax=Haloarcula argentinensis TaxID=43776 RepID=A0A847UQ73_HALAR|nr:hypothetical protein [Haloarcula argentinensis]NLV14370.1 hypothetical protein [Haloarcula argentinensis]